MARETRAVIRLPERTVVASLKTRPRRGQRIRARDGEIWYIAEILPSGMSTLTVICNSDYERQSSPQERSVTAAASKLVVRYLLRPIKLRDDDVDKPIATEYRGLWNASKWSYDWIEKYLGYAHSGFAAAGDRAAALRATRDVRDSWIEKYLSDVTRRSATEPGA